jgi:TPR repeat protein
LQFGKGVQENVIQAANYYYLSVEKGNAQAQWRFGNCLGHWIGVENNVIRAAYYYRLSPKHGGSFSHRRFADCLEHGIGVE